MANASFRNTHSPAPCRKSECDYLSRYIHKNLTSVVTSRVLGGEERRKRKAGKCLFFQKKSSGQELQDDSICAEYNKLSFPTLSTSFSRCQPGVKRRQPSKLLFVSFLFLFVLFGCSQFSVYACAFVCSCPFMKGRRVFFLFGNV